MSTSPGHGGNAANAFAPQAASDDLRRWSGPEPAQLVEGTPLGVFVSVRESQRRLVGAAGCGPLLGGASPVAAKLGREGPSRSVGDVLVDARLLSPEAELPKRPGRVSLASGAVDHVREVSDIS